MATSALPQATSDSWTRHTIDASSRGADGVRAADANGDGLSDLVLCFIITVTYSPVKRRGSSPWL